MSSGNYNDVSLAVFRWLSSGKIQQKWKKKIITFISKKINQ